MDWLRRMQTLPEARLRTLTALCGGAFLLMAGALFLSDTGSYRSLALIESSSLLATPFGVSQGVTDYGGYPSPSNCTVGSSLCYPGPIRIGTLSVYAVGSTSGQTVNVNQNNTQTSVGTPVVLPPGQQVKIEWACQPNQTATQTCYTPYQYQCGCTENNCCTWLSPCCCPVYCTGYTPYECGPGTIVYSTYAEGIGFQTGGANVGSYTGGIPTGQNSYTFSLRCRNQPSGTIWTASATVTRGGSNAANLTATPQTVNWGSASSLGWTFTAGPSCSITPPLP